MLWLPQASDETVVSSEPRGPVSSGSPITGVLVDDDVLVREVLVEQLQEEGYRIGQAPDGLAALALLERNEEKRDSFSPTLRRFRRTYLAHRDSTLNS
jgi:hypothetical protein